MNVLEWGMPVILQISDQTIQVVVIRVKIVKN